MGIGCPPRPLYRPTRTCHDGFSGVPLIMMWRAYIRQHPTLGPWQHRIEQNPSWVTRTAFLAAVLVVVVPLLLLFTAAVIVGIVLFVTLGLVAGIIGFFRRILSNLRLDGRGSYIPNEGRENVRVIRRK